MEKNPQSRKGKKEEEDCVLNRDKLVEYSTHKKYKQHLVFG